MPDDLYQRAEHARKGTDLTSLVRFVWSQRDMRWSLVGASLLLAWDVAFTGSFLMSLICCPLWFLGCILKGAEDRAGWRRILLRMAFPAVTFGLVWANNAVQNKIAEVNAVRVIAACEEFRAANESFPKSLDELVPRYLPSVPRAKYCVAFGHFLYFNYGRPMLVWCLIPPHGRKIYDFETRRWSYMD